MKNIHLLLKSFSHNNLPSIYIKKAIKWCITESTFKSHLFQSLCNNNIICYIFIIIVCSKSRSDFMKRYHSFIVHCSTKHPFYFIPFKLLHLCITSICQYLKFDQELNEVLTLCNKLSFIHVSFYYYL